MVHVRLAAVLVATLAACGAERDIHPAAGDTAPDPAASAAPTVLPTLPTSPASPASVVGWWRPALDSTWQWQLQGDPNVAYDVDVYDIDLFDSSPGLIAELRGRGRRVICYFSAGSVEEWRDDVDRFDDADIGEPLDGWDGERWLDIRSPGVHEVMLARLDLARDKGCDGVEPDNVQAYDDRTGFALTYEHQVAYNRLIADAAHDRGLAVGLKNGGPQVADLLDAYDFALSEECHEYDECAAFDPFISAGKPVYVVEYRTTQHDALALAASICPATNRSGMRTLILPVDLDDRFRVSCFD
ncbi:MAG: endo alpha-1,4 polygalactosaminidase [Ilumatobacteraceae bacterium]